MTAIVPPFVWYPQGFPPGERHLCRGSASGMQALCLPPIVCPSTGARGGTRLQQNLIARPGAQTFSARLIDCAAAGDWCCARSATGVARQTSHGNAQISSGYWNRAELQKCKCGVLHRGHALMRSFRHQSCHLPEHFWATDRSCRLYTSIRGFYLSTKAGSRISRAGRPLGPRGMKSERSELNAPLLRL